MDLKLAIEYLIGEGFVVEHKGKLKFTANFYTAFKGIDGGIVLTPDRLLAVMQPTPATLARAAQNTLPVPTKQLANTTNWIDRYMQFIKKCNVPATAKTATGVYNVNQYSQDGMKAYRKAIEEGVDEEILAKSVALYYNGDAAGYKLKIGNYMGDGTWRTGYMEMVQSLKDGTLKEHITSKIKKSDESSRLR